MNLEDRVITTIQKNLERNLEIQLESKIREDLTLDSFDILMIISALEDEFLITIDEEDFANIVTIKDIVEKLRSEI